MKKKIVNALLMMAVVAPSVGSFMSCKDYNEDLNTELRSEIAKEASLRQALQTQVDNLKATVAAIKSCECDLSKYLTKVEAENTYLTQGAIQSYLDQVSANKAAIEQLQGLVNGINAKLGDLGDKPIVDQINELNTTIINVKAIADEALELAKVSAEVTHNHPEGIKGAQATAAAIFLARKGENKWEIRDYIEKTFGYNLSRTLEEIRPTFTFDETCQRTVPEAIICFLEGKDYEDVVRLAVTLAGDADTLAAIAGSIASATKDVTTEVTQRVISLLSDEFCATLLRFNQLVAKREQEDK